MVNQARQETAAGAARKGRGGPSLVSMLLMLPVVGILFPSCIVLASGMAPSIVAYVVDRGPGKYLTITVALMNFCGTLPGLADLWERGQAYSAAGAIALDPFHWLASYGAAAVGWLIYLALPPILKVYFARTTVTRIEGLRRKQAALVEEWGEDVRGPGARGTMDT